MTGKKVLTKHCCNIVQNSSCIDNVNYNNNLKDNHKGFYQIEAQLLVTNYKYCDLFIQTKTVNIRIRFVPHDALQMEIVKMSKKFFLESYPTRTSG